MAFLIYGLMDPRTGMIRYVGKSTTGLRRPRQHGQAHSLLSDSHKNHWIKNLKEEGWSYGICILFESKTKEALEEAEIFWISELNHRGHDLTNKTRGGEGGSPFLGHRHSVESRDKMSAIKRGEQNSFFGKKHSLSSRSQSSVKHGGKAFCDQFGRVYTTQREAAQAHQLSPGNICAMLKGKHSHVGGFVFRYLDI